MRAFLYCQLAVATLPTFHCLCARTEHHISVPAVSFSLSNSLIPSSLSSHCHCLPVPFPSVKAFHFTLPRFTEGLLSYLFTARPDLEAINLFHTVYFLKPPEIKPRRGHSSLTRHQSNPLCPSSSLPLTLSLRWPTPPLIRLFLRFFIFSRIHSLLHPVLTSRSFCFIFPAPYLLVRFVLFFLLFFFFFSFLLPHSPLLPSPLLLLFSSLHDCH